MAILLSTRPASPQFNIGAMLVGIFINVMLYGVAMLCVFLYYRSRHRPKDALFVKLAVTAGAISDTVGTIGSCGGFFYISVSRWGNYDPNFRAHWAAVMSFVCNSITELIVQAFMLRRYFLLSKQWYFCGFIALLMLNSQIANFFLAVQSAIGSLPASRRYSNLTPFVVALCSTLATDICITIAMFWTLRQTYAYSHFSRHIVGRISATALVTGSITCLVILAMLITYLVYPMSALASGLTALVGRVYSLTMLFTLLSRDMDNNANWTAVGDPSASLTIAATASKGTKRESLETGVHTRARGDSDPESLELTFAPRTSFAQETPRRKDFAVQHPEHSGSETTLAVQQ